MSQITKAMSYSTPLKNYELRDITANLVKSFFSRRYEDTAYIPMVLRLGKQTFEAGKKLFSHNSLWFNDTDKTRYLIEGPESLNYRDYWGLLSAIWPRKDAKVVSDLFANSRNKLRAIVLTEMAKSKDTVDFLPNYLLYNMTDIWYRNTVEFLLKLKWTINQIDNYKETVDLIRQSVIKLGQDGAKDLKKLTCDYKDEDEQLLKMFFSVCNRLRLSAIWAPQETEKLIDLRKLPKLNVLEFGSYLNHRAVMSSIHCLNNQEFWDLSITEHLDGAGDTIAGNSYMSYSVICNFPKLSETGLFAILNPTCLEQIWRPGLLNSMVNRITTDLYSPWRVGGTRDTARYLLLLSMCLRSFVNLKNIEQEYRETHSLFKKIKNAVCYIRNIERSKLKGDRIVDLKNSREIIGWLEKVEQFSETRQKTCLI